MGSHSPHTVKKYERQGFMNSKIKILAAALVICSAFSMCSFTASAESTPKETVPETSVEPRSATALFTRYELTTSKVYNKSIYAYSRLSLSRSGRALNTDVRMINGVPYVALRSLMDELGGMTVTYYSKAKTLNVRGAGFEMDVIDGSNVIYANGRVLFSMTPSVIMTNGRMYSPLDSICKALGLSLSLNQEAAAVNITGNVTPIKHGSTYYDADAVYWLSRIISAESRGESLLGQITVGNVVLNRVKSPLYPNTIWGVIFDRKYGVQFSPIIDGSIYQTPTASAVVAAKICLEGYVVNSESLFFLYPKHSTSSWIPNNREYLFSIGKHDFYA